MKVALTGASGLIGSALMPELQRRGHQVVRLVRRPTRSAEEIRWDPAEGRLEPSSLADVDAVVHLASVNVGDRRWTDKQKAAILSSRVDGTTTVSTAMAAADPRPRVLLSASAVGRYGAGGPRLLTEQDPAGDGWLAEVVVRWEAATTAAEDAGVRVAHFRSGLVCAPRGGIMGRVLPLFKVGLGSRLGGGRQFWPLISLADEVSAIAFLLDNDIRGPVNLTGPEPVTNAEFTETLRRVLGRPPIPPVPGIALRLVMGSERAEEMILIGQRAVPKVLLDHGFTFEHPTAEAILRYAAKRSA
ncbi:MAG: TIGR01777 family oxidoreductase [Geodermatophilaceae bacterium]|nr:TIGR01777 family protein [Geodermatophilaceae bacterium]